AGDLQHAARPRKNAGQSVEDRPAIPQRGGGVATVVRGSGHPGMVGGEATGRQALRRRKDRLSARVAPPVGAVIGKTMINRIKAFLSGRDTESTTAGRYDRSDLQVAAAALLVEAARMDATIAPAERETIKRLIRERFSLSAEEAADLVAY